MKLLKIFFVLFVIFISNSCDPVTCRYCEETEISFKQWMNNKEFKIANIDSTIIHEFSLVDSSRTEAGDQCDINTSIEEIVCYFNTFYYYNCESLNITLDFGFSHSEYYEDSTNSKVDLRLTIKNNKYGNWYSYNIPIGSSFELFKDRQEYVDSIQLNDVMYYDVLELTPESIVKNTTISSEKVFDKVYYSIHFGLIGLDDFYLN